MLYVSPRRNAYSWNGAAMVILYLGLATCVAFLIWLQIQESDQSDDVYQVFHRIKQSKKILQKTQVLINGASNNTNASSTNTTQQTTNGTSSCLYVTSGGNLTGNCSTAVYANFYAETATAGTPVPQLSKRSISAYDPSSTRFEILGDVHLDLDRNFFAFNASTGVQFEVTQRVAQFDQLLGFLEALENQAELLGNQTALLTNLVHTLASGVSSTENQTSGLFANVTLLVSQLDFTLTQTIVLLNETQLINQTALSNEQELADANNATQMAQTQLAELENIQSSNSVEVVNKNEGMSIKLAYQGSGIVDSSAPHILRFISQNETNAIMTMYKLVSAQSNVPTLVLPSRGWYDVTINLVYCDVNASAIVDPLQSQFFDWYLWIDTEVFGATRFSNNGGIHGTRYGSSGPSVDGRNRCYNLHYHRVLGLVQPYLRFWTQFFSNNPAGVTPVTNDGISESYASIVRLKQGDRPFYPPIEDYHVQYEDPGVQAEPGVPYYVEHNPAQVFDSGDPDAGIGNYRLNHYYYNYK